MAALVVIGIATTLIATEPEKSTTAAIEHAAHARENPLVRVSTAAYASFADFLTRDMAIVVLVFVVLYKFCDAFAGAMTAPFVLDLGFSRNDYAAIVKGLGLAATLIGGFAGGAFARAYPLVTSLWIGAILQMASNLVFTWQALVGVNMGIDGHDHRRELHRRDRHRDLRRLSVGAVQQPAAHGDAIRAAHRARRRRAHLPVGRRRLSSPSDRLADLLRRSAR